MTLLPPEELAGLWEPERPYLNTASYGLPPRPAFEALQAALDEWRRGRTSWESWTTAVARARASFASLVGCEPDDVATGATVSELVGIVAASLPAGSQVLAAEVEFASTIFPWLAQEGIETRLVPLERLVESIDERTTLVAVSAVQSADGRIADLAALRRAAPLLLVDATQACGWLPLQGHGADFLVCHSYKWLLSPRGAAFMAVRPERLDTLAPFHAGWWAAEDPYGS
nr:aminotransferase class V-fold PLP-dependent enzyme [Actinomycetota bacterium]